MIASPKKYCLSENMIVCPKIWSLVRKNIVCPKQYRLSKNMIVGLKIWSLVQRYDRWSAKMIVGPKKISFVRKKTISWGSAAISYEPFDNVKPKPDVHNQVCPFCPEHVEDELHFLVICKTFKIQGCTYLPRKQKSFITSNI